MSLSFKDAAQRVISQEGEARFRAVRGTIITTARFSKGTREAAFEPGAAPITIIDGEKLLELLTGHGIAVRKKTIEVLERDAASFAEAFDA
jgi:restriction system protein